MTLLYSDPCFLDHDTGHHPENADRLRAITAKLEQESLDRQCHRPTWKPVSRRRLSRVHSGRYADEIWALAKSGGGDLDADTVVSANSYHAALKAVGAACDAVERIVRGEDKRAVCLVRPPGHHALFSQGMGFCLFNNVAVAAMVAIGELHLDRVLILDWDVHHGNGTQATFWTDPRVGFLSIHRWPFFPGTGLKDETGGGKGLGATLNLPVAFGIRRQDYLSLLTDALERFAAKIKPQLVLVSAGFDTHRLDPVGSLGLEVEDFAALTNLVLDVADAHAGGRTVSILEGGYHHEALAESVAVHVEEMVKREEKEGEIRNPKSEN